MVADGPECDGFVDKEPELVLAFELDHPVNVAQAAVVHVDALHDEEATRNLGQLGVLKYNTRSKSALTQVLFVS